jgi:Flp pilus assembly protein TadD
MAWISGTSLRHEYGFTDSHWQGRFCWRKAAPGLLECDINSGVIMERHHWPAPQRIRPTVLGILLGTLMMACMALLPAGLEAQPPVQNTGISVEYPSNGSIFPPDISPPTFLWRDARQATSWVIEVTFEERARPIRVRSAGEKMTPGELDASCVGADPPTLSPELAEAHAWKPPSAVWAAIKKHSVKRPATVTFTGYAVEGAKQAVSRGQVKIRTSSDPVGAALFYRDVPLIRPPITERGVIAPLPQSAIPLIKWRLRYVSDEQSTVVMQGLPTCANCHSLSSDGRTLGLDVDGPQNDKGLYAIVPVRKVMSIRTEDVIKWSSFSDRPNHKRFGFMSQLSPNGQYLVTSIENPERKQMGRGVDDRFYNASYNDYHFSQVFYPTRGILAWYRRDAGKLEPLPGADDPNYVQAAAFWSPDSRYLVFSRAPAKDPYYAGQKTSEYANGPDETQIQYDLYRIPFNDGRGGQPEAVVGASANGMSNNFPKVSPDGKWIVFVQNRCGLLMRPDSQLYIVPFQGGTARRLNCNMSRMNSWHSFSPNGRWLVFSSKARTGYTQMYLTHIDEQGNDSPAILIENATAANRAVNIPEFANIPPGGLERIDTPATDFYRVFDQAVQLMEKGQYDDAVARWQKALALNPDDAKAHLNLGYVMQKSGRLDEAIDQYRTALKINSSYAAAHTNLGIALATAGRLDEGKEQFEMALAIDPENSEAHGNLCAALLGEHQYGVAIGHCRHAVMANPENAEAQSTLGIALAHTGSLDEAAEHVIKAAQIKPDSLEYQYNCGRVLAAGHRLADAIPHFEKAVSLSGGRELSSLEFLASLYADVGRFPEAVQVALRAVEVAAEQRDSNKVAILRARLAFYEQQAQRR